MDKKLMVASPKLQAIFQTLEELTGKGESVSVTNISQHLDLPRKQVARTMQNLRSAARSVI